MYPDVTSIQYQLPTNDDCPAPLHNGWWQRSVYDISGITIHHTMSHSPWATAAYYVHKGTGHPTIPYHYWICSCGGILQCLTMHDGCWHDHTGHCNRNISIGMAGSLHIHPPTTAQLKSTTRLTAFLMNRYSIPIHEIQGHNDRSAPNGFPTQCPGWESPQSGQWRPRFYTELEIRLKEPIR